MAANNSSSNGNTGVKTVARRVAPNGEIERLEISKVERITITPPKIDVLEIKIRGTAPLVMEAFSRKARMMIRESQQAGSQAKKGKKREPKDFQECYEQAKHISHEGWIGVPAAAFRNAAIDACRLCGFKMTHAKQAFFIKADGFDREDGTPLVRIVTGEPKYAEHMVRNATGVADIRARPMWDPGWEIIVRIEFDGDVFSPSDVINLFARVGRQVGILAGRPFSKNSAGMGWGTFEIVND